MPDLFDQITDEPKADIFDELEKPDLFDTLEESPAPVSEEMLVNPIAEAPATDDRQRLRSESFKMLNTSDRLSPADQRNIADPESGVVGETLKTGKNILGRGAEKLGYALGLFTEKLGMGTAPAETRVMNDVLDADVDLKKAYETSTDPRQRETLGNFVKYFEGNGVTDGKEMANTLKDSIKENVWDSTSDDDTRSLSDGSLRINPKFVALPDAEEGIKAIQAAPISQEEKDQEIENFRQSRAIAAAKFDQQTKSYDADYRKHAEEMAAKGVTDPEKVFYSWDGLDRNFIEKSWDLIRDTGAETGRGLYRTAGGISLGIRSGLEKLGIDQSEGMALDARKTLESAKKSQYAEDIAAARGEAGPIAGTVKDLATSVGEMSPMFAGGILGRAIGGGAEVAATRQFLGDAITKGSVYGWAGAQGYGSIMETALQQAQQKAAEEGREVTDEELATAVRSNQGAALANGFQTAILSKLLPEGSEKAAITGLASKAGQLSGRDVFQSFTKKYGAQGVKKAIQSLKPELVQFAKQAYTTAKVGFKDEALEEGVNQFLEGVITKIGGVDPDKTWDQIGQETFQGAWQGGLIGGALPVATKTFARPSPEIQQSRELIVQAAPLAPESATAAAEIQPETENTDEQNPSLELPVSGLPESELLPENEGGTTADETLEAPAPIETDGGDGSGSDAGTNGTLPSGESLPANEPISQDTLNENETTNPPQATTPQPEITTTSGELALGGQTAEPGIRDGSLEEGSTGGTQQTLNTNESQNTTAIPDAAAQSVPSGDSDTVAFPEDSGTLGIPHNEMPQIAAENRGAMVQFLDARGIPSSEETIAPSELKPSQAEYSQERVDAAKAREGGDRAILISADNHVIDGHHQWVSDLQENPDTPIRVIRLGAPAVDVIEAVRQMPSATVDDSLPTTPPPTGTSVPADSTPDSPPPTFAGDFATEERERAAKSLPPAPIVEKWTEKGTWESALAAEANQKAQNIPTTAGSALFDRLLAENRFTLTPEEHALMVHEIMVRDQTISRNYTDLANLTAEQPPGVRQAAQAAVKKAQGEYDDIWTYMHRVGSAAGSALRARQMQVNMDFSLASMMRNARAKLNQNSTVPLDLSESQIAEVLALHEAIRQGEAREEALMGDVSELTEMVERLTKDVEAAQAKVSARDLKSKSKIKKILDPKVAEAKRRLLERGRISLANALKPEEGKVYSGVSTEVLEDLRDVSIMAAGWLVDKTYDLAEFTNRLGQDFGSWVLEHAEQVFGDSQQIYFETAESVQGRQAPKAEDIIAALDGTEPLDRKDVFRLARAFVIGGKRGNNVLDEVHTALLPTYPELTREQVATLFTDYGKVTYPSKEEVPKELSRVRNLERIALKLQDLRSGKPPLRTGFQRGEQDAEIRELEKQFRQELKDSGLVVEDSEAQLQTALGAAKRRMENEIEELQRALDRGQPRTANTSTLEYDEEALALRSELEAKRAEYATAFDKGMTPEKRVEQLLKSLDRQIAEEDRMLTDGVLKRPKGEPLPSSTEIEERRRILAEKRQNRRDLYEATNPENTALQQAKDSAQKSIERLQALVVSNAAAVKEKKTINPDAELQALWDARETLQDEVAEIRRAQPLTSGREAEQIKVALKNSQDLLKTLESKLAKNDLTVAPKKVSPASRDIAVRAVREQIRQLNNELNRRRRVAAAQARTDAGLPVAIKAVRLKRQIEAIRKRSAELERRIKEKDVSRKAKPAPLVSRTLRQERYKNDKLKAEFSEMTGKLVLQGSIGARAKYALLGTANAIKVLTLSGDLGVVLRQLGTTYAAGIADASMFARIALPGTRAKAQAEYDRRGSRLANVLKTGTRAFFDESVEHTIYEQIRTRAGSEFDSVGGTKVHFAPPFDTFDSQKEDIPRADLIKSLPWWIWPALVGTKWAAFGMSPPLAVGLIAVSALRKPAMLALDRAQRSMTNASRAAWLDEMRFHASLDGTKTLNADDHALMNNAIMVATGRGQIKALDNTVPTLNYLLNAPRFYFSRLQAMTLQPLWKGALGGDGHTAAAQTRAEIAKMYGLSVTGRAIVLVMAALMLGKFDDEKEDLAFVWNPYSPDFGRLRVNDDIKLDTMSGFNGFISITARYAAKKRLEKDGTYTVLGGGFSNNVNQEVANFLSTKRNILLSFLANAHAGAFFGGKKVTRESALEQATTAIITNDLVKVYQELGPVQGTAFATLMFGGAGTVVRPNEDELEKLKEDRTAIRLEEQERERELNEGRDENSGVLKL